MSREATFSKVGMVMMKGECAKRQQMRSPPFYDLGEAGVAAPRREGLPIQTQANQTPRQDGPKTRGGCSPGLTCVGRQPIIFPEPACKVRTRGSG